MVANTDYCYCDWRDTRQHGLQYCKGNRIKKRKGSRHLKATITQKGEQMKITQSWKRNTPSTMTGESITLITVYSSFDKAEIDNLEQNMTKGTIVMECDTILTGEEQ